MIAYAMHAKGIAIDGTVFELVDTATGDYAADAAFPVLVSKTAACRIERYRRLRYSRGIDVPLASLFNSSAMLFTIDFYKRFKPETPEKRLVVIGQIATVVIVCLGILWIPVMRSVGNVLYNYLQDVQSVLAPGIASAFLLGICWKRASAKGGMWGLLSGLIIGLTRLGAKVYYQQCDGRHGQPFQVSVL